jgi:GntR family transcriptional regulator
MKLHIASADGAPIYLQIVNQIKYLIASGRLAVGEELPAIRVLSDELVVNPNTVARAYRELEVLGFVEKRRAVGTFVSGGGSPLARSEQDRILANRVDLLLSDSRQMGFSTEEVIQIVLRRAAEFSEPKDKSA